LVEKVHSQNRLSGRGALAFRGKGALDSRAFKVFEQRKIGYLKTYKNGLNGGQARQIESLKELK
jgi:hypothetical protein